MIDIATLSQEERLRLLEQLWDSLSSTPEAIPLTDAQREDSIVASMSSTAKAPLESLLTMP